MMTKGNSLLALTHQFAMSFAAKKGSAVQSQSLCEDGHVNTEAGLDCTERTQTLPANTASCQNQQAEF